MVGADTSHVTQNPPVMPVPSMCITHNMGESSHMQCGLLRHEHGCQASTETEETQQPLHHKPEHRVQHRHACEKSRTEVVILPPCYQAYISAQF